MKKAYFHMKMSLIVITFSSPVFANVTLGDPQTTTGELTISGEVRLSYQDKNYGEPVPDKNIKFDTAIIRLNYDSPDLFGKAEYRCYQYDNFCDFSTLVSSYVGYRLNSTDNITLGLQPIPFGPGRYWDSSFYASINNTLGVQDILNLGVNYHFEIPQGPKLDIAYFAQDGGSYHGTNKGASRYTANLIRSSDPLKTDLNEKNMWMARIDQDLYFLNTNDLEVSLGGSYWYSEIKNKKTLADGTRDNWAIFSRVNYKDINIVVTGGRHSINNKDILNPHSSTFGSFNSEYEVANKGYFYTLDTSYVFKNVRDKLNVTPYVVFSGFNKQQRGFDESQRNIVGVAWNYKKVSLYTEYLIGKNDPFLGGIGSSLATGDDRKWNKLFNAVLVYDF